MSINVGYATDEIREFVHQYHQVPYGQRGLWVATQPFSDKVLYRWNKAIFEGDLERELIPREGSPMTIPLGKRTALEKMRAAERAAQAAEIAKLSSRVREFEDTNTALGKAIGLLHAMSEEEPARTPTSAEELNS